MRQMAGFPQVIGPIKTLLIIARLCLFYLSGIIIDNPVRDQAQQAGEVGGREGVHFPFVIREITTRSAVLQRANQSKVCEWSGILIGFGRRLFLMGNTPLLAAKDHEWRVGFPVSCLHTE